MAGLDVAVLAALVMVAGSALCLSWSDITIEMSMAARMMTTSRVARPAMSGQRLRLRGGGAWFHGGGPPNCGGGEPGGGPSPDDWHYDKTPTVTAGSIACGTYKDHTNLIWSHQSKLMLSDVFGDPPGMEELHTWWAKFG